MLEILEEHLQKQHHFSGIGNARGTYLEIFNMGVNTVIFENGN
jgi:hypothetical protein